VPPDAGDATPPDAGDAMPPDAGLAMSPDTGSLCASTVTTFDPSVSATQLLEAIADERVQTIELTGGTYHLPIIDIVTERACPLVIRPAAGGTVVFAGDVAGSMGQFLFGYKGVAGRITLQGFIFDGFTMGMNGVIWLGNAHDITLDHITIRNTSGYPQFSWALYTSYDNGVAATNITASNWTVECVNRMMSAACVSYAYPRQHVHLSGWNVSHCAYAFYSNAPATTDLELDDWTIDDSGYTTYADISVYFEGVTGTFSNMHATNSARLENIAGTMTDGGGNTWN
jgi:hypothetical protein